MTARLAWLYQPLEAIWLRGVRPAKTPIQLTTDTIGALAAVVLTIVAAMTPLSDGAGTTQTAPATPARVLSGRETNAGIYLGAPYHYPSDLTMTQPGRHDARIKNIEWFTHPFENPLYYGFRIQRWLDGGRFGSMIDFTHSKAYAPFDKDTAFEGTLDGRPAPPTAKIGDLFRKLEFTHGHNMLTLNGLFRFGSFTNLLSPYAGLGAGISLPHSETHLKTDPARTYEYQYTGPCAQALFGIEIRLRTGSVFLEYKFTIADYTSPVTFRDGQILPIDLWLQFSRWWSGEAPPGGFVATRLTSHQVIGGFLYRFVPKTAPVS